MWQADFIDAVTAKVQHDENGFIIITNDINLARRIAVLLNEDDARQESQQTWPVRGRVENPGVRR